MSENDIELTSMKVGLLGDTQVGKSAICNTFTGLEFHEESISTIGADKFEKKLKVDDGKEVKLVLWDTAGQERFRSAAFKTIRSVHGIALVFAIDNKESFENVELWLNEIKENMDNPCLVLLGNKKDLPKDKWKVTQKEIDHFCNQHKLAYFATSAKKNEGITEAFNYISNTIYIKIKEIKQNNIKIDGRKPIKKKKHC